MKTCYVCKKSKKDKKFGGGSGELWCGKCVDKCPIPPITGKKRLPGPLGVANTFKYIPFYVMDEAELKKHNFHPDMVLKAAEWRAQHGEPYGTQEDRDKEAERQKQRAERKAAKEANMSRMLTDLQNSKWVN